MGKGSNTQKTDSSSTSTMSPDSNAYQAYLGLLDRASGVASTPYQGYTGPQVAGINDQQLAGFGAINNAQGAITATGTPIGAADIQRYMDPYTSQVIDATQRDFDVQNARADSTVKGNAASQGALGGDRSAVAQALMAEQQSRTQAPVIAGLRSQGYQQAVKTAEDQQQQALRAGVAGMQGGQAMVGAGTLEQQTQQAQYTQDRQDYYQKQGYPFQVAQWLAMIDTGVGSQMGGTSSSTGTSTTQGPTPNPWSQAIGGGLALASMFSDRRVKENIDRIGETNDGQPIYRFNYKGSPVTSIGLMHDEVEDAHPEATGEVGGVGVVDYKKATEDAVERFRGGKIAGFAGGGMPAMPWSEGPSWVPQGSISPGKGAPGPAALPQAPQMKEQSSGLSKDQLKGFGAIGKGLSGVDFGGAMDAGVGNLSGDSWGGGSFWGGDAYGGSSANPLSGLDALDYAWRGGRIRRYANGGFADGGDPEDFEDRFSAAFPRTVAGVGASRPAALVDDSRSINPGDPIRMLDRPTEDAVPPALVAWREGVDRDRGTGVTAQPKALEPTELPPEVVSGRSKRPSIAPAEPEDEGSTALGYSGSPRLVRGVAPSPGAAEAAPDESFLGRLGIKMTPELRSGLLQAGLAMMANRRGGPGSFLSSVGEAGMAGVAAHNATVQATQEQAKELRKEQFDREKFSRPYNEMTAAEKARQAKEYKPTYGVIREVTDPDTGLSRKIYGWIDPNKQTATEPAGGPASEAKVKSVYVDETGQPVTGEAFLKRLSETSPERANRARLIGDYKVNPAGLSVRGGRREQALADAAAYNPAYDQREFGSSQAALKNFEAGVESRTVRSLNVAIDHLATLDEAAKALQNKDYPILNKVINAYRENTGSNLTTNFDSIKQVVSAEIAKAVVGGQTALHDRDDMAKRAANSQSPEQLLGITQQFRKLMAGQMKGLRRTYESTTRRQNFDDYLEPETKKALKGLDHVEDNYGKGAGEKKGERTVVRTGTVNSGENKGKKVIEYSDGTREYQ